MSSSMPPPGFPQYSTPPGAMPPGAPPLGVAGVPQSKGRNPAAPTRRVLGLSRMLAIVLAVITLAAAGYINLTDESPSLYVARANTSLTEMTPFDESYVRVDPIETEYLERGAISGATEAEVTAKVSALYGQITRYPVNEGQQIRAELFTGDNLDLAPLGREERLISLPATVTNAVAGVLRPGDRVDVIVVDRREGVAGILAADIEVVAVRISGDQLAGLSSEQIGPEGRDLRPEDLQPVQPIPGLYTVRIPAELATVLALASTDGSLHLVYRVPGAISAAPNAVVLLEVICLNTLPEFRPFPCQGLAGDEFVGGDFSNDLFGGSQVAPPQTGPGSLGG